MNKESTREVEISFGYPPREGSTKPRASAIKIIGDGWTREQEQQLTSDGREIVRRDYKGGALDSETRNIYDPNNSHLLKTVFTGYHEGEVVYTKVDTYQYCTEDCTEERLDYPFLLGRNTKRLISSYEDSFDDKRHHRKEENHDPYTGVIVNSREFSYAPGSEKCILFRETQFDKLTGKKVKHLTNEWHKDGHVTQTTEDYGGSSLAHKIVEELDPKGNRYSCIQKKYHPTTGCIMEITSTSYCIGTGVIISDVVEEFQSDCFLLTRSVARTFDYKTGEPITKTKLIFQGKRNPVLKIEERYKSGERIYREVTCPPQQ